MLVLLLLFWLLAPPADPATVVFTYYIDRGTTYSGTQTRPGVAACSWNYPIGTRIRFVVDGREAVCEDRGRLGSAGHVDLWVQSRAEGQALTRQYGSRTQIEVLD